MPPGFRFAMDRLTLPDGAAIEVYVQAADSEFPDVFARACRRAPSRRDRRTVEGYYVNVCLAGPGGSIEAARRMMTGAAAVVRAGGAGVFVDNSAIAHGSDAWLDAVADTEPGALLYALVNRIRGAGELWSVGMHTVGLRDAVLTNCDDVTDDAVLQGFLEYTVEPVRPMADGDVVSDGVGPTFRVNREPCRQFRTGSPLHNPYGRWRLVQVSQGRNAS